MAVIKSIPSQRIINGQIQETSEISIVSEAYYDTSGESCVVVKSVDNSKLRLNSTTTDHVVVKALTKVLVIPDIGRVDEVMTMADGEVSYWKKRGLEPDYMYELAEKGWEKYLDVGQMV